MKKIFLFFITFLFCSLFYIVKADEYITYSDYSEEYPYWLNEKFIQSEERFLWYKEIVNEETGEIEREETNEYFKELDGYIKIEESKKIFYRYITNQRVLLDGSGNVVYDSNYCLKNFCKSVKLPTKPVIENPSDEIENPKTYDNIFVFLIIGFISIVSIVLSIGSMKNKSSYVESI